MTTCTDCLSKFFTNRTIVLFDDQPEPTDDLNENGVSFNGADPPIYSSHFLHLYRRMANSRDIKYTKLVARQSTNKINMIDLAEKYFNCDSNQLGTMITTLFAQVVDSSEPVVEKMELEEDTKLMGSTKRLPVRGRARPYHTRSDMFRSRPPNTSRPPSMHVDDFVLMEKKSSGGQSSKNRVGHSSGFTLGNPSPKHTGSSVYGSSKNRDFSKKSSSHMYPVYSSNVLKSNNASSSHYNKNPWNQPFSSMHTNFLNVD